MPISPRPPRITRMARPNSHLRNLPLRTPQSRTPTRRLHRSSHGRHQIHPPQTRPHHRRSIRLPARRPDRRTRNKPTPIRQNQNHHILRRRRNPHHHQHRPRRRKQSASRIRINPPSTQPLNLNPASIRTIYKQHKKKARLIRAVPSFLSVTYQPINDLQSPHKANREAQHNQSSDGTNGCHQAAQSHALPNPRSVQAQTLG